MDKVQDSSGKETHQEDAKNQRAGLDVLSPVLEGVLELNDDPNVAENWDHQWSQKTDDCKNQVVGEQKDEAEGAVVAGEHIVAGSTVQLREPEALPNQELWDDGCSKHPPHPQADPGCAHPLGQAFVHEGVHHSYVALDANAGQRRGRTVEVAIETGSDHPTGCLSQNPVVSMEMVVNLKGEGEEEEEVGDRQAVVEDGGGDLSDFSSQETQDGDIGRDAENNHKYINEGDDPGAERAAEVLHGAVTEGLQSWRGGAWNHLAAVLLNVCLRDQVPKKGSGIRKCLTALLICKKKE